MIFREKAHKLQGRTTWKDFDVSIENKPGSVRRGTDPDGHEWAVEQKHAYGYLRLTKGTDGDHLDCYIGNDPKARYVYVCTINNPKTGKVDEQKCYLNFRDKKSALESFKQHYDDFKKFLRSIVAIPVAKFVQKAESTFDNPRLLRASVREALFEDSVRRFREATKRKPRIYYARPIRRYSTPAEARDLKFLARQYPGHEIIAPMSSDHSTAGMKQFFDEIDESDIVIVRPRAKQHITAGARAEVQHALHRDIPVLHLRQGKLRKVKGLKAGTGNHRGNFAKVVFG